MTIIDKIKKSIEGATGLPFLYHAAGEINELIARCKSLPVAYSFLIDSGTIDDVNGRYHERVTLAVMFCDKTEFDFNAIENEEIIDRMKEKAYKWMYSLRMSNTLNVVSVNNTQRLYDTTTDILTGFAVNITIEDVAGVGECELPEVVIDLDKNGSYDVVGVDKVRVNVLPKMEELDVTKNGEYLPPTDITGFSKVSVNVSPYDLLKIEIEETDVVPLIRLMSDTSISSKVTEISDDTTGWTYYIPLIYNAYDSAIKEQSVFKNGGISQFPNLESVQLGCRRIAGYCASIGNYFGVFRLEKLKRLCLPSLESIGLSGSNPDYLYIFTKSPLDEVDLTNLQTNTGTLFRECTLPEELNLPKLTNCGMGIIRSCTGIKRLIVENLTSCPGYSYQPNFVSGCSDLEYIYSPKLSNLNTYGASNGANTLQNCPNLKELVIHNTPFTDSMTPRRYYLRNCPKVEILDLRGSITKSLYLDNYKPSTVIEENLQLFLDNFQTYIADRLPDRSSTTSLSLILSPLVYDTLQESGQNIINFISDKNWTLVKSSLEEIA